MADKKKLDNQNKSISPFNDDELEYFRQIILKKRRDAIKELETLKSKLHDGRENGSDESAYSTHVADMGTEVQEQEKMYILCTRLEKFIKYLDKALHRIDNKTYGICKKTGNKISKGRLEAVPHTQLSIEAKQKQR